MENFSLDRVRPAGGYYGKRLEINGKVTVPSIYCQFKQSGRIDALKCDGTVKDMHIFWDSDACKWLESAAYVLARENDSLMREQYEGIVRDIVARQREDGYFNSYFMTCDVDGIFRGRHNHELYCAGHMFEAAVACAKYLHDDRLLKVSEKYAEYIRLRFVERRDTAFATPGHEEIELALWRLYEFTGEQMYKSLAEFFLTERGAAMEEKDVLDLRYNQSHAPVYEQDSAVGHSVRALYLYTAMADMARINGDGALTATVKALYDDIVTKRMYVTGGVGSAYEGERFASDYFLPNGRAYSETCASIALMMFCDRMTALTGDKKYADTLERAFYNCVLAGISLDGDKFYYVNPLEINLRDIRDNENYSCPMAMPLAERVKLFGCSCCPPNLSRIVERFRSFAFYRDGDTVFIQQYIDADLNVDNVDISMRTDFPYGGKVRIKINSHGKKVRVKVRIPDWSTAKVENSKDGYIAFEGVFENKEVQADFAPALRKIYPNPNIDADFGKVCYAYGPLVMCAESVDNKAVFGTAVTGEGAQSAKLTPDPEYIVKAEVPALSYVGQELYSYSAPKAKKTTLTLIPYFTHANRGPADLRVWFIEK